MSDITESDLLAAIIADYDALRKLPGDVTVTDILKGMRKIDSSVTQNQAAYQFKSWASREDIEVVPILENGKRMSALRKKCK
jgi:hypothetical protein